LVQGKIYRKPWFLRVFRLTFSHHPILWTKLATKGRCMMQRRQARIVASCSSRGSQRRKKKGQAVGQNMRLGRVNLHRYHSYPFISLIPRKSVGLHVSIHFQNQNWTAQWTWGPEGHIPNMTEIGVEAGPSNWVTLHFPSLHTYVNTMF
jgi:hypothetical protein